MVDLKSLSKWYQVQTLEGFKTEKQVQTPEGLKTEKMVLKVTLEQMEGHPEIGSQIKKFREELSEDDENVYAALMTAILQLKKEAKILIPTISQPEKREYRMRLLAAIKEVLDAAKIPVGQRVYSKRFLLRLCDQLDTTDGGVLIEGDDFETIVKSFNVGSGLRRAIGMVRNWALPHRDREESVFPTVPPGGSEKPDKKEDALSALF